LQLPHRETVHLAEETQALFDYYEAVADEKHLQLTLRGAAEVQADRLMLRRALGNLLSNAVRHAHTGSCVQVNITTEPECTVIRVINLGDTLPPAYLERVFDRFFRVDASRQRSQEGTGLGLAITRSIINAHGGVIAATSVDGVTTFEIQLPHAPTNNPG
jgi:two-component system heavy metal sensor histidine kinase CusS